MPIRVSKPAGLGTEVQELLGTRAGDLAPATLDVDKID
jgi:hypothetical protein